MSTPDPEQNAMFQLSPFHQSLTDASAMRDLKRLKCFLKLKHNADLSVAELIISNGDNSQHLHSFTSLYLATNCLEDADTYASCTLQIIETPLLLTASEVRKHCSSVFTEIKFEHQKNLKGLF